MNNRQHRTRILVAAVALTVATIGAGGGHASADDHAPEHGHTPRAHHYHLVDHATGRIGLPVTEFTLTGHGFSNLQGRTSSVFVHNASGESVTVSSDDGDSVRMVIGASLPTTDVVCPAGCLPGPQHQHHRRRHRPLCQCDRLDRGQRRATPSAIVTPDGVTLNGTADVVGTIIF